MSEASPATHTTPLSGWKYGSIGEPLPNTESKVLILFQRNFSFVWTYNASLNSGRDFCPLEPVKDYTLFLVKQNASLGLKKTLMFL